MLLGRVVLIYDHLCRKWYKKLKIGYELILADVTATQTEVFYGASTHITDP